MDNVKEIQKKVILLGDGAVGKTSLIRRFVVDKFDDKYLLTIGSKITAKKIHIQKEEDIYDIKLQIWDILGQKGYKKLHQSSFRGTDGVILVSDLTRATTLNSIIDYWIPEVQNIVGTIPFVFMANKSDLLKPSDLNGNQIEYIADKFNSAYFYTSAKNGDNVKKAFLKMGMNMIEKKQSLTQTPPVSAGFAKNKGKMADLIDRIIDDFCREYGKIEDAMPVLRRQFELAELDLSRPTIEAITKAVENLASIEMNFKDEKEAQANLNKRLKWIREFTRR
jgi:small GTP-binding protein